MPELPEVRLFRLWLARKIVGVEFQLVSKCLEYTSQDPGQKPSLDRFNDDCPQKCVDVSPGRVVDITEYQLTSCAWQVTSRGKELAIVFEKGTMVFQLAMGGFFGLRPARALNQSPVKDLVNLVFKFCNADQHLLLLESDQFRNFARVRYVTEGPVFNAKFGPDILSETQSLMEHIEGSLRRAPSFFKQRSLFEVLHDQRYFNGLGNYTKNEILERLHSYSSEY